MIRLATRPSGTVHRRRFWPSASRWSTQAGSLPWS